METSLTPLLAMKSSALLTLEILWTLILPRSGLAKRSPGDGGFFFFFREMWNVFKVPSLSAEPQLT